MEDEIKVDTTNDVDNTNKIDDYIGKSMLRAIDGNREHRRKFISAYTKMISKRLKMTKPQARKLVKDMLQKAKEKNEKTI